jgi:DNA repair exonuclease SbcCD ATPase subunit
VTVQELRNKLERAKGKQEQLEQQLSEAKHDITRLGKNQKYHEQASVLFREVCQHTQTQIQEHLSDLVSMGMNAIFTNPYELDVEFVQRRGKTECDLSFTRDGNKIDPLAASGYGAVDVASFALRVASWFISGKRTRNVLLLDEPFKHLKGLAENRRVLEMLRMMSKNFGIQIIMVSDERVPREDIIEGADKVFEVTKVKGRSVVSDGNT